MSVFGGGNVQLSYEESSNDDDFPDGSSFASGIGSDGSGGSISITAISGDDGESEEYQRLKTLYPFVDDSVTPYPRRWNRHDRGQSLHFSNKNLRVSYKGPKHQIAGTPGNEPSMIRADASVPPFCGVYYFEVTVVKGRKTCVGVGFCEKAVAVSRMPGWDQYSYGYHGDDGNFFHNDGNGRSYGPTYDVSDTVGAGVNLINQTIFFTKNGINLGIACTLPRVGDLYPAVGFQNFDLDIDVNFGGQPFKYNIEKDLQDVRNKISREIEKITLPSEKTMWLNRAFCSWMLNEGHFRSLDALSRLSNLPVEFSEEGVKNRNTVRNLILTRRATEATERIEQFYPDLFERDRKIELFLKCQVFVEKAMPLTLDNKVQSSSSNGSSHPNLPNAQRPGRGHKRRQRECGEAGPSHQVDVEEPPARRSPGNPTSVLSAATDSDSTQNGCSKNGDAKNGVERPLQITTTTIEEEELEGMTPPDDDGSSEMSRWGYTLAEKAEYEKFNEILAYGRQLNNLRNECAEMLTGKEKELVNDALNVILESDSSRFAKLPQMQDEHIRNLAMTINAAILVYEGHEPTSILAKYYQEVQGWKEDLIKDKNAKAPFFDIEGLLFGTEQLQLGSQQQPECGSSVVLFDEEGMETEENE